MATYGHTFTSGDTLTPTKLNAARTATDIVNTDIKSDAAIAGTKIAPDFGSQNVVTTGTVSSAGVTVNTTSFQGLNIQCIAETGTAEIIGRRSRGSSSSPTIVESGDGLLTIAAQGYDGSTYRNAAVIAFGVGAIPGSGDMPGRITLSTTADDAASPTERMRINAAGNVGIGATAPATTLEVRNPTGNTEYLRVGGGSLTERSLRFSAFVSNTVNNAGHDINAPEANGAITLSTVSTERLRIKTQGQVRFQPLASDPAGAEAGDVYYNSTSNKLRVRTNTAWVDLH
jgi:hypothetical protein